MRDFKICGTCGKTFVTINPDLVLCDLCEAFPKMEDKNEFNLKQLKKDAPAAQRKLEKKYALSREMKITKIAHRARAYYKEAGVKSDFISISMDLGACNKHCPLDFDKMLEADQGNLMHDVSGIYQNLNRDTFKLENGFLPRYAL